MKPRIPISLTREIPYPTEYIKALDNECSRWAFNEERALELKGQWRKKVFSAEKGLPLDLEIGTGNGYHMAHQGVSNPHRSIIGLELKYKPLIQSIRRALKQGCENVCIARYHGYFIDHIFEKDEINNIYIHFPDPWLKRKQQKHRLIQSQFLNKLFEIQQTNSFVELKTDCQEYFDKALHCFKESPYLLTSMTHDLYQSPWASTNFPTQFEKIFTRQGLPIYYATFKKL